MEKRGISGVVTTMLIMLIAIVAISIVWVFVQPAILNIFGGGDGKGGFNKFITCTDLELVAESCSYTDTEVKIHVKRGIGSQNIEKLGFQFSSGNSFILSSDNSISGSIPNEFGSSIFVFDRNDFSQAPFNVRVTGLLDSGACQFDDIPVQCNSESPQDYECGNGILEPGEQCDDGNLADGDGCDSQCRSEGQQQSCSSLGLNVVELDDFDSASCTRTRKSGIPSSGMFNPLQDAENTKLTGASYHRYIIDWYNGYNSSNHLNQQAIDNLLQNSIDNNMKFVLSLRLNHPNKSSIGFQIGSGRSYDIPDSSPKSEEEWANYVRDVTAYTRAKGLVGISLGNEITQFSVNMTFLQQQGRNYANTEEAAKGEYLRLMNITYNAVKSVDPTISVITTGLVSGGVSRLVLADGWNEKGWRYDGNCNIGINVERFTDLNGQTSEDILFGRLFKTIINDSAPYYDYLNVHPYQGFNEDARYTANWIRGLWKDNNIQNKGIVALEFGFPFYNYSEEYHEYILPTVHAVAYHSGFDSIGYSAWYLYGNNTQNPWPINFQRTTLVYPNNYRTNLIQSYGDAVFRTKDFTSVQYLGNNIYEFTLPDNSKHQIDTTLTSQIPAEDCLY